MASAKIFQMDGTETGSMELDSSVFDTPMNPTIVHEVIVALQASKRQGNHETKTRSDVRGGGIKPYRQKGTGNARHGTIREPEMRGGGTVFGPHKRSYRMAVPSAFRRKALSCMLSDRLRTEALCVLDQMECLVPKTKPFAEMVAKLAVRRGRTLFITGDNNPNVFLSARNIPRVALCRAEDLNALDVMNAANVVIAREALAKLESRLGRKAGKEQS